MKITKVTPKPTRKLVNEANYPIGTAYTQYGMLYIVLSYDTGSGTAKVLQFHNRSTTVLDVPQSIDTHDTIPCEILEVIYKET